MLTEPRFSDYRMTTAEILYHLPDYPGLLQSYFWQEIDIVPKFPVLRGFLEFWTKNLDGKLHSVRIATADIVGPRELRHVQAEFRLH